MPVLVGDGFEQYSDNATEMGGEIRIMLMFMFELKSRGYKTYLSLS